MRIINIKKWDEWYIIRKSGNSYCKYSDYKRPMSKQNDKKLSVER